MRKSKKHFNSLFCLTSQPFAAIGCLLSSTTLAGQRKSKDWWDVGEKRVAKCGAEKRGRVLEALENDSTKHFWELSTDNTVFH